MLEMSKMSFGKSEKIWLGIVVSHGSNCPKKILKINVKYPLVCECDFIYFYHIHIERKNR